MTFLKKPSRPVLKHAECNQVEGRVKGMPKLMVHLGRDANVGQVEFAGQPPQSCLGQGQGQVLCLSLSLKNSCFSESGGK